MTKQAVLMLILSLAVVSSCSSPEGTAEPAALTFWTTTSPAETQFFQKRIEAFAKEHPNIQVKMEQRAFPFATNEFKTAVLGDQAVDIFRADNTWIPEYAELGIVYPLEKLSSEAAWSGYIPSALQSARYQGSLYGLPSVIEVPALLYNKRLLGEAGFTNPPATMDELLTMAKAMTGNGRYGLFLTEDSYFALPYLWAFGGGMVTDDRQIEIASADSQKAFEFMVKLRREGVTQPYADFSDWYGRMMKDFAEESRVAMIINGPWAMGDILKGRAFLHEDQLGIAAVPQGPKGQGSPVGGHSLVINRYTKYPKESLELIAYLTGTETQVLQSKEFKTLPTQSAAYVDERLALDPLVQGFKQQLDTAKARPMIPEGAKLFMDFTPNLNAMLLGKVSVPEGVRNIEASWENLLRNR
ncbi:MULTISPECIES: extracellular solute-binding protein [Paenibacillus]|uniref:extracellular solute-binding protein n=1 Tax=Paenibacillus TaxID=44249 RepID=UPI0022B8DF9F|nr:extracellular solute-binding protein [Paenibacillus caseinilyticus]MCZ8521030.1 extracellular solute-binding protein [Paenibacillus caseinilyticus]